MSDLQHEVEDRAGIEDKVDLELVTEHSLRGNRIGGCRGLSQVLREFVGQWHAA